MTAELDMLHKETFPGVHKTLDEFSANLAAPQPQAGRTTHVPARAWAVRSRSARSRRAPARRQSASGRHDVARRSTHGATYTGDLKVVALAAALENLAVTAYQGALTMAGKGQLGAVPPAVATFVTRRR